MTEQEIELVFTKAKSGDLSARQELMDLVGSGRADEHDIFRCLSGLMGHDNDILAFVRDRAEHGNMYAMCVYGKDLVCTYGNMDDFDGRRGYSEKKNLGLCWLEESGNRGYGLAYCYLGAFHEYGDCGVNRMPIQAIIYYIKAYHLGWTNRLHMAADLLYERLRYSKVELGLAADIFQECVRIDPECESKRYLNEIEDQYGREQIASARRISQFQNLKDVPMEVYVGEYGHPKILTEATAKTSTQQPNSNTGCLVPLLIGFSSMVLSILAMAAFFRG